MEREAKWIGDITESVSIAGSCPPWAGSKWSPEAGWLQGRLSGQSWSHEECQSLLKSPLETEREKEVFSPPAPLSSTH